MRKSFLIGAAALAAVSTAAMATWSIDDSGKGFVGKGDVQLALGLNNAQMQAQVNGLTFKYSDTVKVTAYCSKYHEETRNKEAWTDYNDYDRTRSLKSNVAYDPRKGIKQYTGFNLTGWDGTPVINGGKIECPGGWENDYDTAAENGAATGEFWVVGEASGGQLKVNDVALDPLARVY